MNAINRFMGWPTHQILLPDGGQIICLYCKDGTEPDLSLHDTNHNVFRLDANDQVVWQVRRVEEGYVNWEVRHRHAKEKDPTCEGYFDPFNTMSTRFFEYRSVPGIGSAPAKQEEVYFDEYAPGRLLWLITHRWAYDIDPETGIATCTGEQVK